MKIHYIDTQGDLQLFQSDLIYPTTVGQLQQSLPLELKSLSIVIGGHIAKNKDIEILQNSEVWLVPKVSCDVKKWRFSRVIDRK